MFGSETPDFFRLAFPAEVRERLGLMHAWALRMVLAGLDHQPDELADYAHRIATYDDDPARAGGRYTAEMFPGTRYSFAVERMLETAATLLDGAHATGNDQFSNAAVTHGVRTLVSDLVPADHRDSALAVVDRMPPTEGHFDGWRESDTAQLGELYVAAMMTAWFCAQPQISPSRQAIRRVLLQRIHDVESTAWGVPSQERLDMGEQQALDLLDAVLGATSPDLSAFGVPAGRAAINRDPSKRTLLEVDILEAAKAHLLEYPIRSAETDEKLLAAVGRVVRAAHRRQGLTQDRGSSSGMTPTERRRAAKLAKRRKHRQQ